MRRIIEIINENFFTPSPKSSPPKRGRGEACLPAGRGEGVFLVIFLFIFASNAFAAEKQLVDRVIAVVNKEVITQSEFDAIFRPIYEEIRRAGEGQDLNREVSELRLRLLNQMIEDRLVAQEAKKLGIEVTNEEVAEEIRQLKSEFPEEAVFHDQMKSEGVGMADIEQRFRERIAIEKLHEYIIRGKTAVSPEEVEQYYKDHPEEFDRKEQVKVSVITLRKSEEAIRKGVMDEAAKAQAGRLLKDLKKGADFEALAKKYSQDTYAHNGGAVGFLEKGNMKGSLEEVLFSLPLGAVSDVLETEEAYHLFKVHEKMEAKHQTFEEIRPQIHQFLFRKKAHERFVVWMEDLKKKSFISIR